MIKKGRKGPRISTVPLFALLSKALIGFTFEFDDRLQRQATDLAISGAPPSLSMWADVLRFVGDRGVEVRRLPALSGLSKPAINIMVACLVRHGWVSIESQEADVRAKVVRFTPKGRKLAKVWRAQLVDVEKTWTRRFGKEIAALRRSLEKIVPDFNPSIPHYPMTLPNRGGTPTGK